ncbi:hypothetical protein BOO71_0012847 [Deinococcus marmoris]|uniref:Uncharacterized protein n=2 Tax=Deinococcus marmoris TaxID=249408 RepID=A0A1U7NT95_9DEIO|nr:hypothetical protein BOO71_0012847 [Deinococcus marmoris]
MGLLLAGCATAATTEKAPKYDRRNIYDTSSMRPIPHASFINVEKFKQYKTCAAKARNDKDKAGCGKYQYRVPYSLSDETLRVGQDMRQAWQRFEDRYYWRAMLNLNSPLMNLSHCTIDFGQNQAAAQPELVINTENSMYPKELTGKIPQQDIKDKLGMDTYSILPNVPNTDYCAGSTLDLTLMYLPGTCFYLGTTKLFCVEGDQETLNPLAPRPIAFRYDEAVNRVGAATLTAEKLYQADYQKDILKAIKPTAKFLPLLWDTLLTGALVAPTQTLKPDLGGLAQKGKDAGTRLGGVFAATAPVYYAQGLTGNAITLPLRVHTLPTLTDVLATPNPPGVWKLEEFKRTFPQQPSPVYERFGYTNLFSAWTRPTVKLLPEAVGAKPLRQMIYMAVGNNVSIQIPPVVVPLPAPVLIKEFALGLPYAGLQTHFTWQSVPEGYEVPRVSGVPLIDYPF